MQLSLDENHFETPLMRYVSFSQAYTVLESSISALFLHMTMSVAPRTLLGAILTLSEVPNPKEHKAMQSKLELSYAQ